MIRTMKSLWTAVKASTVSLVVAVLGLLSTVTGFVLVPAGTMTQTTNISEAMKIIFADPIVQNYVAESELLSRFKADSQLRSDDTTGGRYVEMAHYFQLPAGVGARQENDYIPWADAPVIKNSRIWLKKVQGTVEMTGDTMRRVASSEGAFLDYAQQALPDFSRRLTHELDRMVLGIGTGVKARIANTTATVNGTAYTGGISAMDTPTTGQFKLLIDRSLGVTGYGQAWLQFLEGERVVFTATVASPTTVKNAGSTQSGRILAINEDFGEITVEGTSALRTALAANDYIAAGDGAGHAFPGTALLGAPVGHREISGLLAGCDDGTLLNNYNNIQRSDAANRLWKSMVLDGSAAPYNGILNEELMVYADDEVSVRGGGKPDLIVTSRSGSRAYWKSLKSDRFFVDPRSYAGGKGQVDVILGDRTLPLVVARKLPAATTFMLQMDTWRRLTLGTWTWDDQTGSIWNRVSDSTGRKDAHFAVGNAYEELFCLAPRKNIRIDGLSLVT